MKIKQLIAGGAVILLTLIGGSTLTYAEEIGYVQCKEYVNIRDAASLDGEVIGKIYNNGQVYVQEYVDNDWIKVKSGNVNGYIKSDYVAVAEDVVQKIIDEATYKTAYVYPEVLIVRAEPGENSREIDRIYAGQEVEVVGKEGDWAKVCLALDSYGYINEYYIDYHTYYGTAESLEEEQDRLDREWLAYLEQQNQQSYQEEETYVDPETTYDAIYQSEYDYEDPWEQEEEYYHSQQGYEDYTSVKETYEDNYYYDETYEDYCYENNTSEDYDDYAPYTDDYYEYPDESSEYDAGNGQYLVDYAQQYIGNPYVYGGTSLTNGTDCSGFTQSVFANNGISIPRTAAEQSQSGTEVSMDDLQAGDLLFYDNGGYIGHVAIYNGDGTVTHASNPGTGITISDADYREPVNAKRYW